VGLPTSLGDLGAPDPSDDVLERIAGPTMDAPHTRNFERVLTGQDLVEAMRALESRRQTQ
jgi:glycerol dehydrogenase